MRGQFAGLLFLVGTIVAIVPTIPCIAAPVIIDWSQGDIQDTQAGCGEFAFKSLQDKHAYTLLVRGAVSGTCSFQADELHFHLPSNYGPTTDHRMTIFHFVRLGSDVIVTWQPDF